MDGIVLNILRVLIGLASQDDNGICAAKRSISGSLVRLPGIVERGEPIEEGVGIDDNITHPRGLLLQRRQN